jgi:hypothetical protein
MLDVVPVGNECALHRLDGLEVDRTGAFNNVLDGVREGLPLPSEMNKLPTDSASVWSDTYRKTYFSDVSITVKWSVIT